MKVDLPNLLAGSTIVFVVYIDHICEHSGAYNIASFFLFSFHVAYYQPSETNHHYQFIIILHMALAGREGFSATLWRFSLFKTWRAI